MTATTKPLPYAREAYPPSTEVQCTVKDEIDYRSVNGPKLKYLWPGPSLKGQTCYLGCEIGSDGKLYFIPGHADRVLVCDPDTDELTFIGDKLSGKFKWLRGVVAGDTIFGIPCHAESVLKIHVPTQRVSMISIPYEEFYQPEFAKQHRQQEWKYHGAAVSPLDGCIYAIPQSALHVLKIDPKTETCELVGPELPGRYKWYGGVAAKDSAIYGIPHDSPSVLRITPSAITLHGDFGIGGHKWHGAAAAQNGDIVSVPANADSVLVIRPGESGPELFELGDSSVVQTGRHRNDSKYKYLGAMAGTDGKVYCFPSGSERVLQVDAAAQIVRQVGPNLYDDKMERICQNKWQNGLTSVAEKCVYGIPLAAESLLRIDCSKEEPEITTWPLCEPFRGLAKFEGGVVAPNGVIYTVPNNHKAILRIEGILKQSPTVDPLQRREKVNDEHLPYRSGIPTLRSSAHRVKFNPKKRLHNPKPKDRHGRETNTLWLPPDLLKENVFDYDEELYPLRDAVKSLLRRCDHEMVGRFRDGCNDLEDFCVPVSSVWRKVNGGQCEESQKYLSDMVLADAEFLAQFDRLVQKVVLPYLKRRLVEANAVKTDDETAFYYQRPPTLRLQPGPAWATVKPHDDAEYGHQNGELNFWIPLTNRDKTGVDLWCESESGKKDFHPIVAQVGQIISFHGSSCCHYVNTNETEYTRVSMDFRIGVEGFFDPEWEMRGTTDDHLRREVRL